MKIAMIGHKRIPSREGGVEIVIEELCTRIVQRQATSENGEEPGFNTVHVYNRSGKHVAGKKLSSKKQKEFKGIRIITIPTIQRKALNAVVYSFFATVRALFSGYDIINYHAEGSCVMLALAHFFGRKTVATIHGLDWQRSKWKGFATKYLRLGEKCAAKYADEVIVLSLREQEYFLQTYDRKVKYITNGVNVPIKRKPELIKEFYGLQGGDYYLFLARLVPEKGLHYLLEAFRNISTTRKLVVAGGSSHTEEYTEQIRQMAVKDARVVLTGFVQGPLLEELFSNCYTYVLPSEVEGMALSLLEALSYGCHCIVSDIEENTEVVGDMASMFRCSDIADLQRALEEDEQGVHHICGEPVSDYCLKKYSWDRVVDEYMEVYQEVTGRNNER